MSYGYINAILIGVGCPHNFTITWSPALYTSMLKTLSARAMTMITTCKVRMRLSSLCDVSLVARL